MNLQDKLATWWQSGGNVWTRRASYPVVATLVFLFAFAMLRGPQGVAALLHKREDIRKLQEDNARLTEENEKLKDKVHEVKTNQSERDNVVRRELNLARPGETTFILKPKK